MTGYSSYKKGEAEVTIQLDVKKGKPTTVTLSTREVEWEIPATKP